MSDPIITRHIGTVTWQGTAEDLARWGQNIPALNSDASNSPGVTAGAVGGKFTTDELADLFGDEIPLVAAKLLFPEKSKPLTTDEVRTAISAIAAKHLKASAGAVEPVAWRLEDQTHPGWYYYGDTATEAIPSRAQPLYATPPTALDDPKVRALVEAAKNIQDYGLCLAERRYHTALAAALRPFVGEG